MRRCRSSGSARAAFGAAAAALLPHLLSLLFLLRREEFSNMLVGGAANHCDPSSHLGLAQVSVALHDFDSFYFMSHERADFPFLLIGQIKLLA